MKSFLTIITHCLLIAFVISARVEALGLAPKKSSIFEVKNESLQIEVGEGESQRTVDIQVSYPLGDGQFPLIVFSHGHGLDNVSYLNLTNYWVEHGYIVVAPLHLDNGGDMAATALISEKYGSDWILVSRLIDLKGIIDQSNEITSKLDGFSGEVLADKVIAAGHSYGALSSQQLSGANLELKGNSIYSIPEKLDDNRIVAVVAVSPPGLMKDHLSEATWQGFSTPQLVVTGPNDFFPIIWPDYKEHFISYLTAEPGNNYLLVLDEMDHYLGNLIGRLEREGPPQTLALKNLQKVSLQFIEHYLDENYTKDGDNKSIPSSDYADVPSQEGVLQFEHR